MSQNGQTHIKNLTAFAARFLKCLTILGHYTSKGEDEFIVSNALSGIISLKGSYDR